MKTKLLPLAILFVAVASLSPLADEPTDLQSPPMTTNDNSYRPLTKRELRKKLTPLQYEVTQDEATEPAFKNRYWDNHKTGIYKCIVCDQDLFSSETKYNSGTGWPSFYDPIDQQAVGYRSDFRLFYKRVEVHCQRCDAHLGMNSAALNFVEAKRDAGRAHEATETPEVTEASETPQSAD
jgi:peptide-methionine (R)-S-oxide reductase